MKKTINIICCAITITILLSISASALSQTDYIIAEDGSSKVPIPLTYEATQSISNIDNQTLKNPQDVFIDGKNNIYIVDTGNNRIVVLNSSYKLIGVYDNDKKLKSPQGIYVDEYSHMFIADTSNQQIVHLDEKGCFVEQFNKPQSELLDGAMDFSVSKIFINNQGNILTIKGQSLMKIDAQNNFKGFIGSNKVGFNFLQTIIRMFASDEQKNKLAKVQPSSYNNFMIDKEGLIYAVTSEKTGQIKKINSVGKNVYPEKFYGEKTLNDNGFFDSPNFIDIAVDENGIISVLEQKYGMVYQYDQEGNLLTAFGGKGELKGRFTLPVSIAVNSLGEIIVLDAGTNSLHIFKPTTFIKNVKEAVNLYSKGKYKEGYEKWQDVIKTDVNYPQANNGIAKALYKSGDAKAAMKYYKAAEDKIGYSEAFADWRYMVFRKNFFAVVALLIALVLTVIIIYIKLKKYSDKIFSKYYYDKGEKQ